MAFTPDQKKLFKNPKYKLMLSLMEMKYMEEDFKGMGKVADAIIDDPKSHGAEKSAALIAKGIIGDMTVVAMHRPEREKIAKYYKDAIACGSGTDFEEEALMRLACYYDAGMATKDLAKKAYDQYLEKFPKGKHATMIMYRKAWNYVAQKDLNSATEILAEMKKKFPNSADTRQLEEFLNDAERLKCFGIEK